ncbi:hypothetical protein P7C71_g5883, partial [Lecanoromycetidae sp. Uapishka_2]
MSYNFSTIQHEATEVLDMPFTNDRASSEKHEVGSLPQAAEEVNMTTFALRAREPLSRGTGKMPGVRCPRCWEHKIETWVISGKHCPKCNHPC